jgi:hypothetical protein
MSLLWNASGTWVERNLVVVRENSYQTLSSRQPFIMLMQAIDFWTSYYLPKRWQLYRLTIQDYSSGAVE